MISIDEKEYRNLQEQVGYLTEELKKLKQSLGDALPNPIPGPTGATGATGATGPQGRTPRIAFGYGPLPDTGYENGDIYVARGSTNGLTKGNMYLRVNNTWQLMLNLVGPQGPQGLDGGSQVVANPLGGYSDFLNKIDIDGVIYGIPTGNYVKYISPPEDTVLTDEELQNFINGVFINGNFVGFKNPVFFPCGDDENYWYGIVIGSRVGTYTSKIKNFVISKETKTINVDTNFDSVMLENIYQLNGRSLPNYPSSPNYRRKLCYNTNNTLSWEQDIVVRHNVTLEINSNSWLTFIIINDNGAPITDISEVLEDKNQLIGGTAVLNDGYSVKAVTVASFGEGDLAIDIGGGYQHIDYNDDITDITDHQVPVIY